MAFQNKMAQRLAGSEEDSRQLGFALTDVDRCEDLKVAAVQRLNTCWHPEITHYRHASSAPPQGPSPHLLPLFLKGHKSPSMNWGGGIAQRTSAPAFHTHHSWGLVLACAVLIAKGIHKVVKSLIRVTLRCKTTKLRISPTRLFCIDRSPGWFVCYGSSVLAVIQV